MLCVIVLWFGISSVSALTALQASEQSYDCPGACEAIRKYMGKWTEFFSWKRTHNDHNKTK